ncbi:hypothetical protein ACWEPL_49665 [Nonomuraea sp. NPDC004186]|uniref:hypothetical protein n=1 Tax=Nonomuraea sp. NPDC049625 TaxID=3155775 RepID=UPI00342B9908
MTQRAVINAIIIGCETGTYLIDRIALAVFTVEIVACLHAYRRRSSAPVELVRHRHRGDHAPLGLWIYVSAAGAAGGLS